MSTFKKIYKSPKVIVLLVFLALALVSINPNPWKEGVAIRAVAMNSSASQAGIISPNAAATPMSREVIININGRDILSEADYYDKLKDIAVNSSVKITTDLKTYYLRVRPKTETITLPELVPKEITEPVTNPLTNKTENVTKIIYVNKTITNIIGTEGLGIDVYQAPQNNIRKGLDLQGGTRVLLEPEKGLSADEMNMLLDSMKERLNVYGLSDIIVTQTQDLPSYLGGSGKQYILIEIAGASKQEVVDLMSKQGKFEAKIGDDVIFVGGRDITFVCRDATCAGIDPMHGCQPTATGEWMCRFRFSIVLTPEAADMQAKLTDKLDIAAEDGQEFLSKKLELYLDDVKVDELRIGADLKGRAVTDIQISGGGSGPSQQGAMVNALEQMKKLQTVLKTGSLPVKLNIANIESISPTLGKDFVNNSLLIGFLAILCVSAIIVNKYRQLKIALPLTLTMVSEIVLLLGLAALIGWNLDLAGIAGIILAVGTGVDNLIVITDEVLSKENQETIYNWKERLKQGFNIILGAYSTTVVAMIPLFFAGAGLLKGFAITTILGATFGTFIARPAYAAIIEILLKEE